MGEDMIINMSVWQDPQSLQAFVYRGDHVGVMRRRREWFERWICTSCCGGCTRSWPTVEEGIERLNLLRSRGPSTDAFTFGNLFPSRRRAGRLRARSKRLPGK